MSNAIEQRLEELGIDVPQAAAPAANYIPFRISGNMLYISGQLPLSTVNCRPRDCGRFSFIRRCVQLGTPVWCQPDQRHEVGTRQRSDPC